MKKNITFRGLALFFAITFVVSPLVAEKPSFVARNKKRIIGAVLVVATVASIYFFRASLNERINLLLGKTPATDNQKKESVIFTEDFLIGDQEGRVVIFPEEALIKTWNNVTTAVGDVGNKTAEVSEDVKTAVVKAANYCSKVVNGSHFKKAFNAAHPLDEKVLAEFKAKNNLNSEQKTTEKTQQAA